MGHSEKTRLAVKSEGSWIRSGNPSPAVNHAVTKRICWTLSPSFSRLKKKRSKSAEKCRQSSAPQQTLRNLRISSETILLS